MAAFCRRCGAEIVTANLMDIDPGMDRAHFALLLAGGRRRYLQSMEWRLFAALYRRHGRVVSPVELARATHTSKLAISEQIRRLRNRLVGSQFGLIIHQGYGYELVVLED